MSHPNPQEFAPSTGANSVTQCAPRPYTQTNDDNSTLAKNDETQPLLIPGTNLGAFLLFGQLPTEVQLMIWKLAAEVIPGRAVSIQPFHDNTPALLNTCVEAREVGEKQFKHYQNLQETHSFRLFINYDIDILYLNHKFRNGKKRMNSALTATLQVYPMWIYPVQHLALNVKEMKRMTSAYRQGRLDMWKILHESCPHLKTVLAVLNGPTSHGLETRLQRLKPEHGNKALFTHLMKAWKMLDIFGDVARSLKEAQALGLCVNVVLYEVAEELVVPSSWEETNILNSIYISRLLESKHSWRK